jgi:hypothetical protein
MAKDPFCEEEEVTCQVFADCLALCKTVEDQKNLQQCLKIIQDFINNFAKLTSDKNLNTSIDVIEKLGLNTSREQKLLLQKYINDAINNIDESDLISKKKDNI